MHGRHIFVRYAVMYKFDMDVAWTAFRIARDCRFFRRKSTPRDSVESAPPTNVYLVKLV